jgi:hypothetical protein
MSTNHPAFPSNTNPAAAARRRHPNMGANKGPNKIKYCQSAGPTCELIRHLTLFNDGQEEKQAGQDLIFFLI